MSTMSDVQQTNTSMAEPKQLDIEDAILARWEDADENQPSEDEDAVATSEDDQEALDPSDEIDLEQTEDEVETEDELDDDTDPDDEEAADDPDEDDAEEGEEDEDELQLVPDDAEVEVRSMALPNGYRCQSQASCRPGKGSGRKSQETAAQRKEAEAAMDKTHHVMQAMLQKAEEQVSRIKRSICSWRPPNGARRFSTAPHGSKQAEDNLKFLTEEAMPLR